MERTLEKSAAQILVPSIAITDGELLMRFARHGDEQAFAALVEKHGRLVWTVCWQVLREHHAIEDAFQSTFFILAKRARSIRSCDSLCGWLYRVAYRTALRSRMSTKTRPLSVLGSEADTIEEWSELDEKLRVIEQDEQRAALLEELQSLPEKYQQVLALCYLEGKTRRAIADELGCSLETVKGRLARGRQVLRHRLIRRGVSLSLAMAAMTVPVKVATAAVTPNLIGLTVTGATAFAAGTLGFATLGAGSTKIAAGAGVAKVASIASTQVIHLAHQGTIAMTIASFAKPAVIAVALLGVVSGTLAVDSSDAARGGGTRQALNLSASVEGEPTVSEELAIEHDGSVVTVAANEDAQSIRGNEGKKKNFEFKFAGEETFEFAAEKQRVPAPPRSPQPVKIRTPALPADVLVPAMPPMPEVAVTAPLNVTIPDQMSLKLQVKIAALDQQVSELQLKSKELEIRAFEAEDEKDREELMIESRRVLMKAEAEKLKIKIEQQREHIKALEEALEVQAKEVGKQTAKAAMDADVVAVQAARIEAKAEKAVEDAAVQAKQAAERAAQAVKWKIQERAVYVDPNSDQPLAFARSGATIGTGPDAAWTVPDNGQEGALSLLPGDRVELEVVDADANLLIQGEYTVEPMGTIALGAAYGRAQVAKMSVIDAEQALLVQLREVIKEPRVQVKFVSRPQPRVSYAPAPAVAPPSDNADSPTFSPKHEPKPSERKESK